MRTQTMALTQRSYTTRLLAPTRNSRAAVGTPPVSLVLRGVEEDDEVGGEHRSAGGPRIPRRPCVGEEAFAHTGANPHPDSLSQCNRVSAPGPIRYSKSLGHADRHTVAHRSSDTVANGPRDLQLVDPTGDASCAGQLTRRQDHHCRATSRQDSAGSRGDLSPIHLHPGERSPTPAASLSVDDPGIQSRLPAATVPPEARIDQGDVGFVAMFIGIGVVIFAVAAFAGWRSRD